MAPHPPPAGPYSFSGLLQTAHQIVADLAPATGLNPWSEQLLLTLALAFTVAVAIKVVEGLLIIPAAAARPIARTPEAMAICAALIDAAAALGGLLFSFGLDTPTGLTIVVVAAITFSATQSRQTFGGGHHISSINTIISRYISIKLYPEIDILRSFSKIALNASDHCVSRFGLQLIPQSVAYHAGTPVDREIGFRVIQMKRCDAKVHDVRCSEIIYRVKIDQRLDRNLAVLKRRANLTAQRHRVTRLGQRRFHKLPFGFYDEVLLQGN